jgi:hypothetical protein
MIYVLFKTIANHFRLDSIGKTAIEKVIFMIFRKMSRQQKIYLQLAMTILILAGLVYWAAWAYYTSEGAVQHRTQLRMRDACFDQVKYRHQLYLEKNGLKQPDGSYTLPEKEQLFIDNVRKEEYRKCSELYFLK